MIRLAFMTDPAGVIGSSDEAVNSRRFELLPKALVAQMSRLYQTRDAVLAGERSLAGLRTPSFLSRHRMVLTRNKRLVIPPDLADASLVDDVPSLARQFSGSRELLVIGGLTVLQLLLPYADQINVALTDEIFPGNLVFKGWDGPEFGVTKSNKWPGGRTLNLSRLRPQLHS